MKNITKVISSIVGVVGSLAGISLMASCSEEEPPVPEYGPPPFYDQCKAADNYQACADCCELSDDAYACVEDYVKKWLLRERDDKIRPACA